MMVISSKIFYHDREISSAHKKMYKKRAIVEKWEGNKKGEPRNS